MKIFGYQLTPPEPKNSAISIVPPTDDGAIDISGPTHYGYFMDMDGAARSEMELIKQYREISMMSDVGNAVDEIINQAIAFEDDEEPVKINLDKTQLSETIKEKIEGEFKDLLRLLEFGTRAQDYFRRWYVDGRIFFHKVMDPTDRKKGIIDIRYIDPRKIKKVREVKKERDKETGVDYVTGVVEYFVYNQNGISASPSIAQNVASVQSRLQGIKIAPDAISYAPSGLFDSNNNMVVSNIHTAIKPANELRMMEMSAIIYRLARAPQRRIFYIDVGNLPKNKAEQYMKSIMDQYRNKIIYDVSTGKMRDDKKFMSILDDFWLARREGGKGTEIDTLEGAQSTGVIEEVTYYQHKLYEALKVPISRLEAQGGLNFGRQSEITRDELKFSKFVGNLQRRFAVLFNDLLKTQLLLKNIITPDDWNKIEQYIYYKFAQDIYYAESKRQEILQGRFDLLGAVQQYQGIYVSKEYIWKNVLGFTEEDIELEQQRMSSDPPNPLAMAPAGNGMPIDTDTGLPLGTEPEDNKGPSGKPSKTKKTEPKKAPKGDGKKE